MGRKTELQETVHQDFNFSKQFLRPRQSGPHGTCHAYHTLDTPLAFHEKSEFLCFRLHIGDTVYNVLW